MSDKLQLHASCCSINNIGVLISGESGTGKSSLCVDLINRGAALVSDDRTNVRSESGALVACAPKTTEQLIELYGIGILRSPCAQKEVPVAFEVCLKESPIDRLPDEPSYADYCGMPVLQFHQPARDASVVSKILFLAQVFQQTGSISPVSVAMQELAH